MGIAVTLRRWRTGAPRSLRMLYRLARSFEPTQSSRELPDELINSCRFVTSRVALLDELPRHGAVAEIGTDRGDFARLIIMHNRPRELHLIDVDFSRLNPQGLSEHANVYRHCGWSHDEIGQFPDSYFDWVYVDADHSYRGTLRDARAAASKIKPGGFIVFNDFAHIDQSLGRYGVHRAVVDFALESRWPMAYFAFAPSALYDVALQKPQ